MAEIRAGEVRIWDKRVGAVATLRGKPGYYEFQYDPDFVKSGVELSPLQMPLFNIVLCFWSMLFAHLTSRQNIRKT